MKERRKYEPYEMKKFNNVNLKFENFFGKFVKIIT